MTEILAFIAGTVVGVAIAIAWLMFRASPIQNDIVLAARRFHFARHANPRRVDDELKAERELDDIVGRYMRAEP